MYFKRAMIHGSGGALEPARRLDETAAQRLFKLEQQTGFKAILIETDDTRNYFFLKDTNDEYIRDNHGRPKTYYGYKEIIAELETVAMLQGDTVSKFKGRNAVGRITWRKNSDGSITIYNSEEKQLEHIPTDLVQKMNEAELNKILSDFSRVDIEAWRSTQSSGYVLVRKLIRIANELDNQRMPYAAMQFTRIAKNIIKKLK